MTAVPRTQAPTLNVVAEMGPVAARQRERHCRDWDETPAEAARYDDRYWDDLYERDED